MLIMKKDVLVIKWPTLTIQNKSQVQFCKTRFDDKIPLLHDNFVTLFKFVVVFFLK